MMRLHLCLGSARIEGGHGMAVIVEQTADFEGDNYRLVRVHDDTRDGAFIRKLSECADEAQ